MSTDWDAFHRRRARLGPPLKPTNDVVACIEAVLAERDTPEPVLLLGATSELACSAPNVLAIDWSAPMIAQVWRGAAPTRPAIQADWRRMPLAAASCAAAMGDGSLNCVRHPRDYRTVLAEVAHAVRSRGVLAMRVYLRPECRESLADVASSATAGASFHALKWRIAMALAENDANVPVVRIRDAFEQLFASRRALAARTGWTLETIAEIDAYAGSDLVYSFPTAEQLVATLPGAFEDVRLIGSGDYPLAERCPILAARRT